MICYAGSYERYPTYDVAEKPRWGRSNPEIKLTAAELADWQRVCQEFEAWQRVIKDRTCWARRHDGPPFWEQAEGTCVICDAPAGQPCDPGVAGTLLESGRHAR